MERDGEGSGDGDAGREAEDSVLVVFACFRNEKKALKTVQKVQARLCLKNVVEKCETIRKLLDDRRNSRSAKKLFLKVSCCYKVVLHVVRYLQCSSTGERSRCACAVRIEGKKKKSFWKQLGSQADAVDSVLRSGHLFAVLSLAFYLGLVDFQRDIVARFLEKERDRASPRAAETEKGRDLEIARFCTTA